MAEQITQQQSLEVRLGSDVKFPISGSFQVVKGIDLLLQDIQLLLLTVFGERVGRPGMGSGLKNQLWENIDAVAISAPGAIKTALNKFEPRINILSVAMVEMNRNTGLLLFRIQFIVKSTDTVVNLVFPMRVGSQLVG